MLPLADVENIILEILRSIRDDIAAMRSEHEARFESLETSVNEIREQIGGIHRQIGGIHGVLGAQGVAIEVLRDGQNRILAGVLRVTEDHETRIRKLEDRG